jgi:hypothetical protein
MPIIMEFVATVVDRLLEAYCLKVDPHYHGPLGVVRPRQHRVDDACRRFLHHQLDDEFAAALSVAQLAW